MKTFVCSVLLYRSETWTIEMIEEKKILALEVWCYKIIQKISCIEYTINDTSFQKDKEIKCILKILKSKKAKIIRH